MDPQELERIIEAEHINENSVIAAVYVRGPEYNNPRATLRIGFFNRSQEGPILVNQANYPEGSTGYLKKLLANKLSLEGDDIVHLRKLTDLDVSSESFEETSSERVEGFVARYCRVRKKGYRTSWINKVQIGKRLWANNDLILSPGISSILGDHGIRRVGTPISKLPSNPEKRVVCKLVPIISSIEAVELLRQYL
ncbi:hypothetical protein HOC80_03555 [archaeon]|jgi:hypothetical protein|nr:hypothetical protein [archaeon]MBT4417153.1 hypothetical protein [archaeon]